MKGLEEEQPREEELKCSRRRGGDEDEKALVSKRRVDRVERNAEKPAPEVLFLFIFFPAMYYG